MRRRLPLAIAAGGVVCIIVAAAFVGNHVFGGGETKPRIPVRSAAEALPPEPPPPEPPPKPEPPAPDEPGGTCVYKGLGFSPKRIGCVARDFYWSSGSCNSQVWGNDQFLLLTEGNHDYTVAARARRDRWNIRVNSAGRPMLGYIIRTSGSRWTLYNPKGRRIGHITGPDAVQAALFYLHFGSWDCIADG